MSRAALTLGPGLLILFGPVACRQPSDRSGQEIRNIVSAKKPPAYLEGTGRRWPDWEKQVTADPPVCEELQKLLEGD